MPYEQVTFAQFKSDALARTGNPTFFSDAEMGKWINEAIRVWQVFTGYWRVTKTLKSQQGNAFYQTWDHPTPLLRPLRVRYQTSALDAAPLTVLAQESMLAADQLRPGWQGDANGVPKRWFPVGISRICLNPAPSITGRTISVDGLARAPVLSADTDYINLSESIFNSILDYVAHIAAFKQGGAEFTASMDKYKSFIKAAGDQNLKFKNSSIYRRALGLNLDPKFRPVEGRAYGRGGL